VAPYFLARGTLTFLSSHFSLPYPTVRSSIIPAFESLLESTYITPSTHLGSTIDLFQTHPDGCTYLSPSFHKSLHSDYTKFRFLVLLIRQLGYHFAKCNGF
jgi:hypothetical protein